MSELVRICGRAELPAAGQMKECTAEGKTLCLANIGGVFHALDNECPHLGGPLAEGQVEEGKVVCPWHAWAFDPRTGVTTESNLTVAVYAVSVVGEDVMADLQQQS